MGLQAQDVQAALEATRETLLQRDNVVGVGLGMKERSGRPTGDMAVMVLVSRKLPRAQLATKALVPEQLEARCCTDVIEVGVPRLLGAINRLERTRPVQPGISIGHNRVTAGTLGAVVADLETGEPLLLSNNHVLANLTDGADNRASVGDSIVQPGIYDGGTVPGDIIGELVRFVPLVRERHSARCRVAQRVERAVNLGLHPFAPAYRFRLERTNSRENRVDAAVARPVNVELVEPWIVDVGLVQGTAQAQPGMHVIKSGRTTGVTEGRVRAVDVTIRVALGELGPGLFVDQIVTTPMAQPGDSGSLVLTRKGQHAVGLLSAGSNQASVVGTWQNVEALLEVGFSSC